MNGDLPLSSLLINSANEFPQNVAIIEQSKTNVSYQQLNAASDQLAQILQQYGVIRHSRVGLWMAKSAATVVALFGVLKCGAAYVPADASGPVERNSFIFQDCAVTAILIERTLISCLEQGMGVGEFQIRETLTPLAQFGVDVVLVTFPANDISNIPVTTDNDADPLSYILYTSGSTGNPKGVPHSHQSAMSFINWCSEEFCPTASDRFSSHAPFHFDLSILDIYLPIKHGASICIIGESLGKQPIQLAEFIAEHQLTHWYSTPSTLRMLTEFGQLERHDFSSLKKVFFAGEVFPIKQLQQICKIWAMPSYYNLYGPTETNVCTYYKVTRDDQNFSEHPVPIGRVCSGDQALIVDVDGNAVAQGEPGELYICGGSVMNCYWNSPQKNAAAFHVDANGQHWYKTGDIVYCDDNDQIIYQGRGDRMIKKRGFRVELGEIECALYRHQDISEAAVIAFNDANGELKILALVSPKNREIKLSIIKLKLFCSENLPYYMVPDRFKLLAELPKTSTDKINYQSLKGYI